VINEVDMRHERQIRHANIMFTLNAICEVSTIIILENSLAKQVVSTQVFHIKHERYHERLFDGSPGVYIFFKYSE